MENEIVRFACEDGETFAELAERLDISLPPNVFYRLTKTESVNSDKQLILYDQSKDTFITDPRIVLGELGLKAPAKGKPANYSISPKMVSEGFELYIPGTSPRRKLTGGFVVAIGISAEDTTKVLPPARKKRMLRPSDDDDDEEEEKPRNGKSKAGKSGSWLTKWSDLDKFFGHQDDELYDSIEVTDQEAREAVDDCDMPVPIEHLSKWHTAILDVLRDAKLKWDAPKTKQWHVEGENVTQYTWDSAKSAAVPHKLIYFGGGGEALIALEKQREFAVIFTMHCGHPGIVTNGFTYANSDGSGDTLRDPMPGTVTPDLVLIRLLTYVWDHGHDLYH